MLQGEIIKYLDNLHYLKSQSQNLNEKIMSIRMGDLTICTDNKVLSPEAQIEQLLQELQVSSQSLGFCEEQLNSISKDELHQVYISLMQEEPSPLQESRLNSLAILLGRTKEEEIKR